MDFRFAGFISVSLFAHLMLLVVAVDRPPVKIGGPTGTLSVTLISPAHAPPASPEVSSTKLPVRAPAALANALSRPATVTAPARNQRPAMAHPEPASQAPAHHSEPASVAAASTEAAPIRTQISAALQHQLAEQFSYPWLARKRGWQGRVTLSLHIAKNGDLSRWEVARTSGHQVLDRSALDSARRIHSLPEAATLLNGTALDLLVPVHYQLLDS